MYQGLLHSIVTFIHSSDCSTIMSRMAPLLNLTNTLRALATLVALPAVINLLYFINYVIRVRRLGKILDQLPGLPRHWLWGNMPNKHKFKTEDILPVLIEFTRQFPRIRRAWFGPLHCMVTVTHPDTVKVILKSSQPKNVSSTGLYNLLLPWLGEGLLLSNGRKWARNRRLLSPAFHFDILKGYADVINDTSDILLDKLREYSGREYVDIVSLVTLSTLDTILRCAFSIDMDIQRQGCSHPYVSATTELSALFIKRSSHPLLRLSDFLYYFTSDGRRMRTLCQFAHQMSEDVIKQRRLALLDKENIVSIEEKKYPDFLDILLTAQDEDGVGLSNLEIRNEVDTFLFGGHDTTTSGISWLLYCLANHPDVQDKARSEVDHVLSDKNNISWDNIGEMSYLSLCIKESLRLYPPVLAVERLLTTETPIDGVPLPEGASVFVQIYSLHRNPVVWGNDCNEYKPERFRHDNIKHMDPYAYVPFSAGPRNCLGQNFAIIQMKIVVSKILKRFVILPHPSHYPAPVPELTLRAKYGIKLFFRPRCE